MAEAHALARALDQPGYVGDRQLARGVRRVDGSEHRRQRRERIVGDLRPRIGDPREQRRLARVRQARHRGVREQLQAQLDVELLAGQARLCEARRLPRGGREALVPASAGPAAGERDARARPHEIDEQPVLAVGLRADRDAQLDVGAVRAVLERAGAVAATTGLERAAALELREIAPIRIREQRHVAALAAVAPVRPALGNVLLAAEAQAAVAAATRLHVDAGAVVEHAVPSRRR